MRFSSATQWWRCASTYVYACVFCIFRNSCPGSVMFLFKTASGRNYLHTGMFYYKYNYYTNGIKCPQDLAFVSVRVHFLLVICMCIYNL